MPVEMIVSQIGIAPDTEIYEHVKRLRVSDFEAMTDEQWSLISSVVLPIRLGMR